MRLVSSKSSKKDIGEQVPQGDAFSQTECIEDRRSATRFDVSVVAEVDTNGELLPAHTKDLGANGVGLVVSKSVERGTCIAVNLFLIEVEGEMTGPLELPGTVVWVSNFAGLFEIGVRFSELSSSQHRWLNRFLGKLDEPIMH